MSLFALPDLVNYAKSIGLEVFNKIEESLERIKDYAELIDNTIAEDAPPLIKEGGILKAGVSSDLISSLLTGSIIFSMFTCCLCQYVLS